MNSPSGDPSTRVPVLAICDILVVGASTAAAVCAESSARAGRKVVAVSDRAYFGEESAGALRLEAEGFGGEDPILATIRASSENGIFYPGAIKRLLEQSLLAAGARYLYYARPVLLLKDTEGSPAGAVFASRTSLFAIRARRIVDATPEGLVLDLTGQRGVAQNRPAFREWTVLSAEMQSPGNNWEATGLKFRLPTRKGNDLSQQQAWRRSFEALPVDAPFAARAAEEFHQRAAFAFPNMGQSADAFARIPVDPPSAETESTGSPIAGIHVLGAALAVDSTATGHVRRGRECATHVLETLPKGALPSLARSPENRDSLASFAATFVRPASCEGWVDVAFPVVPLVASVDVLIAGGGTGGASAGISVARTGASSLVLETQHALGGVGTAGLIARYWFGNRVGFTAEMDRAVTAFSGASAPSSKGTEWNPEDKSHWLMRALREAGGEAWLGSFAFGVRRSGARIESLLASTPFGIGRIDCAAVIDATGNADIPAAAGAPCRVIGADHVAVQGTGLSPRNPNMGYRNTDHTFIDDCDIEGVTYAFTVARAKFAGEFDTSSLVDSRERRQIRSDLELSPLDFLAERTFPDTVVTAESNFDTHGFTVHPVFQLVPPHKKPLRVHVPYRCMLPKGLDNLLVTGLGMGAHRDALPVVRMQADVQNQGYATGLACVRAIRDGVSPRDVDIRAVQRDLVEAGVLEPEVATHPDSFPLPAETLRAAVQSGPTDLLSCAVLVGQRERVLPELLNRWETAEGEDRERLALLLGMLGRPEPAAFLAEWIDGTPWDEGWNYCGMGQFGRSSSPLDDAILALAGTSLAGTIRDPLIRKINALDVTAAFSHCRAVAVAAASAPGPEVASALARLLSLPEMGGHVWRTVGDALRAIEPDPNETGNRNRALREISLARGLFLSGDRAALGRKTLEAYANDMRGQLARHAQAILDSR